MVKSQLLSPLLRRRDVLKSLALFPFTASPGSKISVSTGSCFESAPSICLSHLGYQSDASKIVLVRADSGSTLQQFTLFDISNRDGGYVGTTPFRQDRLLTYSSSALGSFYVGDFSDVQREGIYQIQVGTELSYPFTIRSDIWRRTLPTIVGYHRYQRCGTVVPGVHAICHLDDGRMRDTDARIGAVGGWHDAGDLRKIVSSTLTAGFGLSHIIRQLGPQWDLAGSGLSPLLEELKWGNMFFLKMQDSTGSVFQDTAMGLNGTNSDNHWTDNIVGTADDRYVSPAKPPQVQGMFAAFQAIMASIFGSTDPAYAAVCRNAAERCWAANEQNGWTITISWWAYAAAELFELTHNSKYSLAAVTLGRKLLWNQQLAYIQNQTEIRGYWYMAAWDQSPYHDPVDSALPAIVLLKLTQLAPYSPDLQKYKDAVSMYLESYALPLISRSPFGIMPYGAYIGSPTTDRYRPLAGQLTYRNFMPVARSNGWWVGSNSHLLSHAVLLAMASGVLSTRAYKNLAYRQLEWLVGANPFQSSMITGIGWRQIVPYSPYIGAIPGGIVNGVCGDTQDASVLDLSTNSSYHSNEYWTPQNAYFEWAVSVLETT